LVKRRKISSNSLLLGKTSSYRETPGEKANKPMRHNKKRNTALLYEFLIRHVSKCLIESRKDEANKAVAILKKYYKAGSLREELDLFNHAFHTKVKSAEYASKLLGKVLHEAKRIHTRRLDESKTKLIKEINRTFDANAFFAHKIPNYVMYASLQTLLNNATGQKKLHESVNCLQLEEKLVNFMLSERTSQQSLADSLKLDPQYNNAVYRIVINKFNEKYAGALNEAQKKLLSKYAVALISENKKVLSNAIAEELLAVKTKLSVIADKEIARDKDLVKKILECRQRLDQVCPENASEATIISMLQFMSLAEEVSQ
jgi:hypothetical protein